MSTQKKLEAIKVIVSGFNALYAAIEEDLAAVEKPSVIEEKPVKVEDKPVETVAPKEEKPDAPVKKEETKKKSSTISKPKKEEPVGDPPEDLDKLPEKDDDLDSMTDAELKALAKDMGIRVILGMKRQRILDAIREKIKEENKKEAAKVEKAEELPEDSLMKRLREETEDMTDDELRELLSEADISEKGGRTALLSKLYDAVKKGIIKIDEEEDESVDESDGEDAIVSAEDEEEETDTPERINAMEVFEKENREAFEKGQLEVGDMKNFLKENFDITMPKKATPAEVLDKYIECASNFIDDDGNTVEEGAYCVRGVPHCCGVPLKITKDKSNRTIGKCDICGESYDIDEEN